MCIRDSFQAEVYRIIGLAVFFIGAVCDGVHGRAELFRNSAVSGIVGIALLGRNTEANPVVRNALSVLVLHQVLAADGDLGHIPFDLSLIHI